MLLHPTFKIPLKLASEEYAFAVTSDGSATFRRPRAYGKAHRKPKPDAIRKRLAADYALDLCERFGVKTTTARTGKFCLVAAALFGDPDVDLQYHCMKAISQKPAQK
jgi:hypothetical protein